MAEQQGIGRKQLIGLFLCSLFVIMYAGPLLRLLPVHASQMGATPSGIGMYLALVYIGLVGGTLVAGWLSDRYQRKKMMIIVAGLIASLSLALMSQATLLWQLSLSTVSAWFFGGITYLFFSILAGLSARKDERGKVFGLLAISLPLATLLAAPIAGVVADRWGYPTLLAGYAVFALIIPITTCVLDNPIVAPREQASVRDTLVPQRRKWFSSGCYFLASAIFIMAVVSFANTLGLSLAMYAQTFSSAQIAVTVSVGSLVSIPLIYLFGWL